MRYGGPQANYDQYVSLGSSGVLVEKYGVRRTYIYSCKVHLPYRVIMYFWLKPFVLDEKVLQPLPRVAARSTGSVLFLG